MKKALKGRRINSTWERAEKLFNGNIAGSVFKVEKDLTKRSVGNNREKISRRENCRQKEQRKVH